MYIYRFVTVHVTELLHMLHQHVLLRYTKPSSRQKRTIPAFSAPKAQGPTPTGSTPQTSTPPPPDPSRKEALELPLELCRTVATACPGDLRKGLQVAQLLSVPGRWERREVSEGVKDGEDIYIYMFDAKIR